MKKGHIIYCIAEKKKKDEEEERLIVFCSGPFIYRVMRSTQNRSIGEAPDANGQQADSAQTSYHSWVGHS